MFTVYILRSARTGRHYIGYSADVDERFRAHNAGRVRSTKAYRPWEIIRREDYVTKEEAYKRERQIKSYKSGVAF
ncbi:MAG: GIY-YIG nuclease family protein [Bacteroidota bacterium]